MQSRLPRLDQNERNYKPFGTNGITEPRVSHTFVFSAPILLAIVNNIKYLNNFIFNEG